MPQFLAQSIDRLTDVLVISDIQTRKLYLSGQRFLKRYAGFFEESKGIPERDRGAGIVLGRVIN